MTSEPLMAKVYDSILELETPGTWLATFVQSVNPPPEAVNPTGAEV